MQTPRYASLADAADYAAVSTRTLRRWIADGRLEGHRLGPRLIRIDLHEIDALFKSISTGA